MNSVTIYMGMTLHTDVNIKFRNDNSDDELLHQAKEPTTPNNPVDVQKEEPNGGLKDFRSSRAALPADWLHPSKLSLKKANDIGGTAIMKGS